MDASTTSALTNVAIAELPAIIGYLKVVFARKNPDAPAPTEAEVMAAYTAAYEASVAKDEAWLAAHPLP